MTIQINYLTVEYERKFNLGNFESVGISAGVQAKVEDENPQEVLQLLMDIAKETVRNNIPPSYRNCNPSVTETFFKNGQRCDRRAKLMNEGVNEDLPDKLSKEELAARQSAHDKEAEVELMDDYLRYGNQ